MNEVPVMKVGSIFMSQKENHPARFFKKKEEGASRKFKNEWSTGQVMLMAFWYCYGLVYTEFDPDACKEKQNVTEDISILKCI